MQILDKQMFGLVDMETYIRTPKLIPKLILSEKLDVSEDFRKATNDWLRERFGYKEPVVPNDSVYISKQFGMTIMSPSAAALIDSSAV